MNLKLQQIWHALVLAEAGSYTVAARRVNLSQPALSRSIQRLEAECNATLFDRTAEGVVPTAVGRLIVKHGTALLRASQDMQREVELTLGLDTGQLAIGAGTYPASISVGKACGRLLTQHPGVKIDVRVGDWSHLIDAVFDGSLDVVVAETGTPPRDDRLVIEQLPVHRGHFICRNGHPLTARNSLTLGDIKAFPLVSTALPARVGALPTTIRVDTFSLLRDIVLHSDAIGLAATIQVATDERAGRLQSLPLTMPSLHTAYGFIRLRARTPSPATLAFMETLREVEAGLELR
jgi:DNA-binding transcriptional LysR family regulator